MRPTHPLRLFLTRALTGFLAWTTVLFPVTSVYGAPTPLADIPIASKVSAKPNIIFTLDDSGSMQYNFLPDYLTNVAGNINVSLSRQGPFTGGIYRARTNCLAKLLTDVDIDDWINVIGANKPEYNGFFKVVNKFSGSSPCSATTAYIEYEVGTTAGTPIGVATGYSAIQIVTSASYCRSGAGTATCAQQAVNISSTGSAISTSSITRPGPISIGGTVTATVTGTAINFAPLNTGDFVLIQHSSSSVTPPSNPTSWPYYGVFQITKISSTQFTYQIDAVANVTPLTAAGGRQVVIQGGSTFAHPPLHAAGFNRLAYNPAVTYTAPKIADGTPLTNSGTDTNGNYASSTLRWGTPSVDRDPYSTFETAAGVTPMWAATVKDNLSIKVGVQLYCNTDWPTLVNDPNWPSGPNGATALDVGDSNGQYRAGSGAWCRINGTKYDASAASGAPAADADYNYPWQSSNGTVDAKFFYRQLGNKVLWCDTTSPYYPKNTAQITGCVGGTPIGNNVSQTCNPNPKVCNPDVGARNYNPSACKTDPAERYCAPGTGGSGSNTPGTGTVPECLACTCIADTPPATFGKCSITGSACNVNADCPDQTTNITSCSGGTPTYANDSAACGKLLFNPYTNAVVVPNRSMLDDANGDGVVCRRNNRTYAVMGTPGVGGLATYGRTNIDDVYPANKAGGTTSYGYALAQQGKFTQGVTSGCPTVNSTVQIPRHYYVVESVEFCDNRNMTANDQWRGFGAGTCAPGNDLQRFKEVKYGKFTRVDLFPGNALAFPGAGEFGPSATPYPGGRVWLDTGDPRPETSESINYANWYAYYSTRLLAAKTTASQAFSYLTNVPPDPIAYRVGFHTLGDEPDPWGDGIAVIWLDVADWDLTQRTAWYAKLFGIAVDKFKTPTLSAMVRIGNLVETGGASGVPAYINPLPAGASDPIAKKPGGAPLSCQANYHILFTDGKTNQVAPVTSIGDRDDDIEASLIALGATGTEDYQRLDGMVAGAWPAPFRQGVAVPDTLADVATYYWARDLRPGLKNDVPNQSGEQSVLTCTETPPLCTPPPYPLGVYAPGDFYYPALDPTKDVAFWQHVNFNAISFGAEGTLDAAGQANQLATILGIKSGALNWPNLTNPYNPIYPKGLGAGAVAVDDLWHATVMARGSFVFARSPIEVSYGLASILAGIQNQRKSRAGAAFGGQVLDAGNDVIFEPTIEPGWAGDLLKIQISPATGNTVKTWWSATKALAAQIDPNVTGVAEPWMDPDHRRIVTMNGTAGVPFQWAELSSAQRKSLAPGDLQQKKIVAYLRGGNAYAGAPIEGTGIGQFRKRFGVMGDISNAKPVIVFNPDRPYQEATDAGYAAFKTAHKDRAVRVVAAANDGMVHVFDAGPMPKAATSTDPAVPVSAGGGTEVFAYMPKALFKGEAGTVNEDASGIQALTYQDGGVPIYKHHMYVDSSPRTADVDFGSGGSHDWRTIVVGGLGKGGNSYYALDLTDPNAADEGVAAGKVLWEWSNSEVKYSYGRPVIVKVRDSGGNVTCDGGVKCRWVVIVTGGYDNTSGKGKVFFLDAKTGTLLNTITTSAGQPSGSGQASGLAQIHAFVKNQNNQIAEQIYGGDLLGNVWRIDVSDVDSYKTAPAVLFAQLEDPSGAAQPVTVAPQIEIDINSGVDRYVFVGTGRLLDTSDLTTPNPPQTQTMYAIRDGTLLAPASTGLPIKPRLTMSATNADGVSAIAGGAPNGWYHDLPNVSGNSQRIVVDPQSNVNVAAYVGTKVQDDPCLISLPATLYARDYTTGEALTMDGSTVVSGIDFEKGLVDIETVGMIQDDGSQVVGIIGSQEVPGIKPAKIKNKFTGIGTRMSWRLLGGE